EARLPYDARVVLTNPSAPVRGRLLEEVADEESRRSLHRAYDNYRGLSPETVIRRLLGSSADSPRGLAILYYAWERGRRGEDLGPWLARMGAPVSAAQAARLARAYGNPRLTVLDHGWLLRRSPLELFAAGQIAADPHLTWEALEERSVEARRAASAWLFQTKNRHAQDVRLSIRIEQDAFARMTPAWQRLGFP